MSSTLDQHIQKLKKCEIISEDEVKDLCRMAKEILMEESNIQRVDAPVIVSFYLPRFVETFMASFMTFSSSFKKVETALTKTISFLETSWIEDTTRWRPFCYSWLLKLGTPTE